eukprot:CAMPEP_0114351898 /NCGR_PEP_ID=MMETSP0101-20121206/17538_1 /TAXON_ID=38822 ORGANISM="Pteridomonas danica, Strain PT" /NCGR_SAMPLE_ID=MMETSP0101 /ASSEMBLY_ACC=CAM_ASM_000211 /LENGTH=110 /DNA_ID=CAMNT_0001492023 /DNA_START=1048 /DNA_END=1380 /DNA_ORIENTATION=+
MKDDGETEEVIEYEEDNAEKELQLKNEKSYYRILNKTIKHATAIQEIRAEQLRRDPFDSKLIVSRRQGDQEAYRAKHVFSQAKEARRMGKSGPWDEDDDAIWDNDESNYT